MSEASSPLSQEIVPYAHSRSSSEASYDSFVISDGARQQKQEERTEARRILETQAYLLMLTPWYDRGWTFQEALFSRRKIVFQNGGGMKVRLSPPHFHATLPTLPEVGSSFFTSSKFHFSYVVSRAYDTVSSH